MHRYMRENLMTGLSIEKIQVFEPMFLDKVTTYIDLLSDAATDNASDRWTEAKDMNAYSLFN